MSVRDRRSKEEARLRKKILAAALRVFAREGYDRVTMRKIAARIDYSATTIYRFFRGKEDLLGAIAAGTYGELAARFETAAASGAGDPVAALKAVVLAYVVFCVERPDMFRLYLDLGSLETEDGVLYERLGGTRYRVFQTWFGAIRDARASGRLAGEDEMQAFLYLFDAANGHIQNRVRYAGLPRPPVAAAAAGYLDRIFLGLTAVIPPTGARP